MRWIYILRCENGYYYVGETRRLFRRFWEHTSGKGGINTQTFIPESIEAIYPVHKLCKFIEYNDIVCNNIHNIYFDRCRILRGKFNRHEDEDEYDYLQAENVITDSLKLNVKDHHKIRGGKYVRLDIDYNKPTDTPIHVCKCGLPCDINGKDDFLYFRCAKKNMWEDMISTLEEEIDVCSEPCDYFKKYNDRDYTISYNKKRKDIFSLVKKSPWVWQTRGIFSRDCIGGCGKLFDDNNTLRIGGNAINLCFECFTTKQDELSLTYKKTELWESKECLID